MEDRNDPFDQNKRDKLEDIDAPFIIAADDDNALATEWRFSMAQLALFSDFTPKPKLRLAQVEDYLSKTEAMGECPSRQTLINYLEAGALEGVKVDGLGWLVYKDSFKQFLQRLDSLAEAA